MMRWVTAVALVLLTGCEKDAAKPGAAADEHPVASSEPEQPEPEPSEPTLLDQLATATSLADAVALTVPGMADGTNETSLGALALAYWASERLTFAEVEVAKNETKPKVVHKDSDRERGKRMCLRGRIVQISKEDLGGSAPVFVGLLMLPGRQVVHYIAAGDTGELVDGDRARFCGVTTGRYTYSNAGGGTTHAIELVGMFDLPSNRASSP